MLTVELGLTVDEIAEAHASADQRLAELDMELNTLYRALTDTDEMTLPQHVALSERVKAAELEHYLLWHEQHPEQCSRNDAAEAAA
jgi:hypothetical protein